MNRSFLFSKIKQFKISEMRLIFLFLNVEVALQMIFSFHSLKVCKNRRVYLNNQRPLCTEGLKRFPIYCKIIRNRILLLFNYFKRTELFFLNFNFLILVYNSNIKTKLFVSSLVFVTSHYHLWHHIICDVTLFSEC